MLGYEYSAVQAELMANPILEIFILQAASAGRAAAVIIYFIGERRGEL